MSATTATAGTGAWLDTREAAARLRVSRRKIHGLVAAGKLPTYRVGKKCVFDPAELDAAVRSGACRPE